MIKFVSSSHNCDGVCFLGAQCTSAAWKVNYYSCSKRLLCLFCCTKKGMNTPILLRIYFTTCQGNAGGSFQRKWEIAWKKCLWIQLKFHREGWVHRNSSKRHKDVHHVAHQAFALTTEKLDFKIKFSCCAFNRPLLSRTVVWVAWSPHGGPVYNLTHTCFMLHVQQTNKSSTQIHLNRSTRRNPLQEWKFRPHKFYCVPFACFPPALFSLLLHLSLFFISSKLEQSLFVIYPSEFICHVRPLPIKPKDSPYLLTFHPSARSTTAQITNSTTSGLC